MKNAMRKTIMSILLATGLLCGIGCSNATALSAVQPEKSKDQSLSTSLKVRAGSVEQQVNGSKQGSQYSLEQAMSDNAQVRTTGIAGGLLSAL
jgi:hypothetical protein